MNKPFVSIITPTKDRIEFITNILRNFYRQDYPNEKMELLIGDEGGGNYMEKLLPKDRQELRYFNFDKITIGEKRNKLCELAKGEIIIFMDDDDYYPEDRVSHAVEKLLESDCLVAGCSEMYIYFSKENQIFLSNSFGKNHATCATIALKKKYLDIKKFNKNDGHAEESFFLNNFKTKIVKLDTTKTIICIAHQNNTINKYKFGNKKLTNLRLKDFNLKDVDINFYKKIYDRQKKIKNM